MPSVPTYDLNAQAVGEVVLPDAVFASEPETPVLHQAVVAFLADQRQGTASAKSRGEVVASTKKHHRQKGTGRARAGAVSSPTRVGGGAAHGPKPREYRQTLPKKMKKLALKSALSAKLAAGDLILLEGLMLEEISTRRFAAVVRAFQLSGSVLFAVAEPDEKLRLSARNLPEVEVIAARELNPYRVLACKKLLLSRDGVAALEEIAT